MTSFSEYQLCWCDVGPSIVSDEDAHADQYVFESVVETSPSLSRVKSVQDLLELISGGDREATTKAVVGILAALAGNLIARGQWQALVSFVALGLTVAIFQLRAVAMAALSALVLLLLKSVWEGHMSLEWLLTVAIVASAAVISVMVIRACSRRDPRNYVLLKVESSKSVVVRNQCCMDVKMLSFNPSDSVRFVPRGGLLPSKAVVPRDGALCIGDEPPYSVKIFAPFETELGTWTDLDGTYVLRATAPPVNIRKSTEAAFANCTEKPVVVCFCEHGHWTCSLWLPLAQLFARLMWPGHFVEAGQEIPVAVRLPCVLRVYTGFVKLMHAQGGFLDLVNYAKKHAVIVAEKPGRGIATDWKHPGACCVVHCGERVEYVGSMTWPRPLSRSSASSFLGGRS